jgi:hypothetical protein
MNKKIAVTSLRRLYINHGINGKQSGKRRLNQRTFLMSSVIDASMSSVSWMQPILKVESSFSLMSLTSPSSVFSQKTGRLEKATNQ